MKRKYRVTQTGNKYHAEMRVFFFWSRISNSLVKYSKNIEEAKEEIRLYEKHRNEKKIIHKV